jgi:arylsulfatase A-like enzyme
MISRLETIAIQQPFSRMKYLTLAFLLALAAAAQGQDQRPNIIFMMADDHAFQALSAYSDKLIETPNIDRLAKEGMRFDNASVTNSICAPSRAVILTGKHSHLNGKIDNISPFDTTNLTFPQILQAAGYQTAMFGKLHFGNNPKGFDEFMILPGQGHYYNPDFITARGDTAIEGYVTDIITDLTLDWLDNRRRPEQPFLLMYLHKAPHREWFAAERHYPEFLQKTFPAPPTLFDDYAGRSAASVAEMNLLAHMNWTGDSKLYPELVQELGLEDFLGWGTQALMENLERMTPAQRQAWEAAYRPMNEAFRQQFPSMDETALMHWRYQRYMQDYLATIAGLDENVGRLLDYLDENGLTENTIVVYTSDQGFYLGEHGWFDKRFMYEESFRTPLLMRWPGAIAPGSQCGEMVQNLDFAQTFLDAAGLPLPEDMQGESLLPLVQGQTDAWGREAVYYHYYEYPGVHAVRRHYGIATKDWKLIRFYYDIEAWELYDRRNDPHELHNLYGDPAYAATAAALKQQLAALREKYGDSEELDRQFLEKSGR